MKVEIKPQFLRVTYVNGARLWVRVNKEEFWRVQAWCDECEEIAEIAFVSEDEFLLHSAAGPVMPDGTPVECEE